MSGYYGNLVVMENGKRLEVHFILTYRSGNYGQGCIGHDLNEIKHEDVIVVGSLGGNAPY